PANDAFAELLRVLRDPIPPLGALRGAVPEMPAHFQPRPNELSALASTLLYDIDHPAVIDGPLRTTVLHGMGGVGKSVLAAAFARSSTARRVFGDGIIWATATPTMPALEIIRNILLLTGSPLGADATLSEGVTALRSWLDTRRCLIVIDNVWQVDQAAPLGGVLSTVSRLLLTSRDGSLATALGANARPLDVLAPDAALRHLADWVGATVDALPDDALAIAKETGYLPLALSLQGALARDGLPWADLLHALRHAELDFAEQRFPNYPYPHVLASLRVSVDMLRAEDASAADRFMELAGFLWEEGVPEAAVTRFWAYGPAGIPDHRSRKLLAMLERKAMLRLEGTAPNRRVRLHDLMIDFLVATGDGVAANRKLIDAYRAACRTDWPDGPNDGYFLEHLLDHLARLPDGGAELYRLLRLEDANGRHAWFEAIDAAGRVDRYRQQLQRLLADPTTTDPRAARLALLLGSLTARAANMPAPLLDALVSHQVWSPARALDYARQLPVSGRRGYATDAGLRMRTLLTAAKHVPDPERSAVVDEALAAARDAEDLTDGLPALAGALAAAGRVTDAITIARRAAHGDARTTALATVATHADGADRDAIIAEAITVCANTGGIFRSAALEPIVPLLADAAGVRAVLAAAVEPLEQPIARGWCESRLAARLAETGSVPDALALAQSIEDPASRADALASLVKELNGATRDAAIDAVLQTLGAVDDEAWRADVVRSFADLPSPLVEVVPVIFHDQFWRPAALRSLAAHVTDDRRAALVRLVSETEEPRALVEGAAAIAPALSEPSRANLIERAIETVGEIRGIEDRARAIAVLAPVLDTAQRAALVAETLGAMEGEQEYDRVKALTALVPALASGDVPRVLEHVGVLTDVEARVGLIETLVPALGPGDLLEARAVIEAIGDRDEVLLT
ncbi:MAG TPA: NB-ARC domain-containing protein, partial [Gemmatimonadaceae bacterium]|nr:NB-ARC domain-containing protein [Gemmatimonadaceae bacterium]